MKSKTWLRVVWMGFLIVALGVPSNAWTALARQEGPQGPPPDAAAPTAHTADGTAPTAATPAGPAAGAISVQSNLVNVDAVVTDQDKAQVWSDGFLNELKPKDWVALKTFDLRTTLQVDFTQDKREVDQAIRTLGFPGFHEANLFDAVYETVDQVRDVKGKKSILVIASGYDTFSKHTLDQILRRLKEADVTIFCVGTAEAVDLYTPNGGGVGYLQAKNQLSTFARMTGGYAWFPRFDAEVPGIFGSVAAFLRNQYTLVFSPNTPQDGRYHKLSVEVLDDQAESLAAARGQEGQEEKGCRDRPRRLHGPRRPHRKLTIR